MINGRKGNHKQHQKILCFWILLIHSYSIMFNFIVQNEFDVLLLIWQNLSKIQKMLRKRKGYGVHTCIYIYDTVLLSSNGTI